ncbi:MAG: stage II sporulation protein E [Clostridium perfringens]|nr:stage II sporulation protein E [Clostridium perfringens]
MQYGAKVNNYVSNKNSIFKNNSYTIINFILYFIIGLLISRVNIDMSFGGFNSLAPFGIAYSLSVVGKDKRTFYFASLGIFLGYISLFNKIKEFPLYLIILMLIIILQTANINIINKQKIKLSFLIIFSTILSYGIFITKTDFITNLIISCIISGLVYPIYFMMRYSIKCIDNIYNEHIFNSNEIITLGLVIGLLIVGIGEFSLFEVKFRNIMAVLFVITLSYGTNYNMGACIGSVMGIVLGFVSGNLPLHVAIYSSCGLIAGIFKETGKILTFFSFNIMYLIINMYCNTLTRGGEIETLVATAVFLLVPKKVYKSIFLEISENKKIDKYSEDCFNKVKDDFIAKTRNLTDILGMIGNILKYRDNDNEKEFLKNKYNTLIDDISEKTCANCERKLICWKNELNLTYNAFTDIIDNYEDENGVFPRELEKKCLKKYTLIKNLDGAMSVYRVNENLRKRLMEGRELLSNNINNMALTIDEIIDDFDKELNILIDTEKDVKTALSRDGITYNDILCYNDKYGRLNIKIQLDNFNQVQICEYILPIINSAVGKAMCLCEDGFAINKITNRWEASFEEEPKYKIISYAVSDKKFDEEYTGDSYSNGKTKDGSYIMAISDGMGSGREAGVESKMAVEIMEKFMELGFDDMTAINTINSIIGIKFSEEEKFATLDMQKIDLYSGKIKFMKVGAVESFIKRKNNIEVINSNSLPFGALDKVDIDIVEKSIKDGDFIISISDGVLDNVENSSFDISWLINFLENSNNKQPKDLAIEILKKAKLFNDGKAKDDMTVIVSKVMINR